MLHGNFIIIYYYFCSSLHFSFAFVCYPSPMYSSCVFVVYFNLWHLIFCQWTSFFLNNISIKGSNKSETKKNVENSHIICFSLSLLNFCLWKECLLWTFYFSFYKYILHLFFLYIYYWFFPSTICHLTTLQYCWCQSYKTVKCLLF